MAEVGEGVLLFKKVADPEELTVALRRCTGEGILGRKSSIFRGICLPRMVPIQVPGLTYWINP